ncbi:hypothetical protein O0I10_006876 [Lichtheimia ornata]|uniref:Uncharacterized protein n=1 Tax=Lichtheimia ornata TaxID=688661 RepID=A0AAD7XY73_9FUNG|nr:uncharacterized protein O0I10_006876 [Lichtheimia ornata]KAJ8657323.1 hypothetical protein O0I10_006876 [Lichtheimia ornata]
MAANGGQGHLNKLPLDVVLHIHSFLPDWIDKFHFAATSERLWSWSSRLELEHALVLGQDTPVNTLQIICARTIKLPDRMNSSLLKLVVQHSYSTTAFHVSYPSSKTRAFGKRLLRYIDKRHDASKIAVYVHHDHANMWNDIAKECCNHVKIMVTGLDHDTEVDIDKFVTPEEAERTKQMIKELAVMSGRCALRSNIGSEGDNNAMESSTTSASQLIPFGAIRLLKKGCAYEFDTLKAIDDQRLSPTAALDLEEAQSTAVDIGERYIEALVIFGSYWFLVTSVDVFLHGCPTIDDCAHQGDWKYQESVQASIAIKSRFGQSKYIELSLSLGAMELLAVGGFFGHHDHPAVKGFLGSSIKDLPHELRQSQSSTHILIRKTPATFTRSNRHLRQYAKSSSSFLWSLHSHRFVSQECYPVNPLAFGDHPITRKGRGGASSRVASMIMKCISKKRISKNELDMMLMKLASDSSMKKVIKGRDTVTFNSISKKMMTPEFDDINTYMKTIIAAGELLEGELNDREHASLRQLSTFTAPVVNICNAGFSERISSANTTAISAFLNKYPVQF